MTFCDMQKAETSRLATAYYHAGKAGLPKLMLIHGNAADEASGGPL